VFIYKNTISVLKKSKKISKSRGININTQVYYTDDKVLHTSKTAGKFLRSKDS